MNAEALVFVLNLRQLEYAVHAWGTRLGEIRYVCLSPACEYAAGKSGLPAVSAEDCWDPADLARRDLDRWRRCEEFARFLDVELDRAFDGMCSRGEFSALFYVIELKQLFDSAERMVVALSSVVKQFRPHTVACMTEPAEDDNSGVCYQTGDIVYRVLECLRPSAGFELLVEGLPAPSLHRGHPVLALKRILRGGLNRVYRSIGSMGMCRFFPLDRNLPVVGIGRSNTLAQLPDLVQGWRRAGGAVVDLSPFLRQVAVAPVAYETGMEGERFMHFWEELRQKPTFKAWFDHEGFNLFKVMEPWLESFIRDGIPKRIAVSRVIETKLRKRRVSVFLTPSKGTPGVSESLLACRRLGIPACSVQHGGMGFYTNPIVEYGDHMGVNYALTFGSGSVEFFKKDLSARDTGRVAEPVAIGNPTLQRLYRKFRKKKAPEKGQRKKVLYIPTHLVPDFYCHGLVSYPPLWYSRLQRRIVRAVKDFPEVELYIKPYPVEPIENPLRTFLRDQGITNVRFLPAFVDMAEFMGNADLLLIDYPSTSLLKMLCTRKPMIVYYHPGYLRFWPKAHELLSRRARVCTQENEFEAAFREYCALPAWPEIADPDDSFLMAFGIGGEQVDAREELGKLIPRIVRKDSV